MGTLLRVTVTAPSRSVALRGIELAFRRVEALEAVISSWRADSELSRLNAAPVGDTVALSPQLVQLLSEVARWSDRTERAFDPAVGPLIDAWDLRGRGRVPQPAELNRARAASGLDGFEFDPAAGRAGRRRADAWLSAGGFGKGAALRDARTALERVGIRSGLLDFGGQLLALGPGPGDSGWVVGVAHPARRDSQVVRLRLRDRSVATTAAGERFVVVGDARYGHVLDPRTGRPVKAWGSVTVVHDDPVVADILSTALFVMGPERGMAWASGVDDVGVLILRSEPGLVKATWNRVMQAFLEPWPVSHRRTHRAAVGGDASPGWQSARIGELGDR